LKTVDSRWQERGGKSGQAEVRGKEGTGPRMGDLLKAFSEQPQKRLTSPISLLSSEPQQGWIEATKGQDEYCWGEKLGPRSYKVKRGTPRGLGESYVIPSRKHRKEGGRIPGGGGGGTWRGPNRAVVESRRGQISLFQMRTST